MIPRILSSLSRNCLRTAFTTTYIKIYTLQFKIYYNVLTTPNLGVPIWGGDHICPQGGMPLGCLGSRHPSVKTLDTSVVRMYEKITVDSHL